MVPEVAALLGLETGLDMRVNGGDEDRQGFLSMVISGEGPRDVDELEPFGLCGSGELLETDGGWGELIGYRLGSSGLNVALRGLGDEKSWRIPPFLVEAGDFAESFVSLRAT